MDHNEQHDWHEGQAVRADLEAEARAELEHDALPYVDPAELDIDAEFERIVQAEQQREHVIPPGEHRCQVCRSLAWDDEGNPTDCDPVPTAPERIAVRAAMGTAEDGEDEEVPF